MTGIKSTKVKAEKVFNDFEIFVRILWSETFPESRLRYSNIVYQATRSIALHEKRPYLDAVINEKKKKRAILNYSEQCSGIGVMVAQGHTRGDAVL